ncbi:unnamed protein product, partial [Musa acuminata var. zebrina]
MHQVMKEKRQAGTGGNDRAATGAAGAPTPSRRSASARTWWGRATRLAGAACAPRSAWSRPCTSAWTESPTTAGVGATPSHSST